MTASTSIESAKFRVKSTERSWPRGLVGRSCVGRFGGCGARRLVGRVLGVGPEQLDGEHSVSPRGLEDDGVDADCGKKVGTMLEMKTQAEKVVAEPEVVTEKVGTTIEVKTQAAKVVGEYQKPDAVYPKCGLGAGDSKGCKAVRAIKLMAKYHIELSVMDEAAAIDGSRPLEQVADSSGIAWGSVCMQMAADMSHFKILMMVGKGLTPAQQAWPPLTLEGYAQLEGKRAQRRTLGSMRSICWTDHANWTKQQVAESIDVKHLRWVSEIIEDEIAEQLVRTEQPPC